MNKEHVPVAVCASSNPSQWTTSKADEKNFLFLIINFTRFLENNAALKAQYMINKLMEFRAKEKQRLLDNPNLNLGDVTTVNLTIMEGGVQVRV